MHRLEMLLNVHHALTSAAGLPEGSRPYSVQSRLDKVEEQIMEEVNNSRAVKNDTPPPQPRNDDDIPF